MNKKRMTNIIGLVLMGISAIFLFRRIISLNVNLIDLLTPINIIMILVMSFIGSIVILINTFCWQLCLSLFFKGKISICKTFSVYARANIMKYLPGNVGHYAGRQFYGAQLGIKQHQLAIATILELVYSALVMVLFAFFFSAKDILYMLRKEISEEILIRIGSIIIITLLTVCVGLFVFRNNKYIYTLIKLICSFRFWRIFFVCVLLNTAVSFIIATEYVLLLRQYTPLDLDFVPLIFSANYIAIFIGYITPGVPGGIGVRETVLTTILSPYFPEGAVILAAFSHRIAIILMDLVAVPVSGVICGKTQSEEKT